MDDELYIDIVNNDVDKYFCSNNTINIKVEYDIEKLKCIKIINECVNNNEKTEKYKIVRIDMSDINDESLENNKPIIDLDNDITHLEIYQNQNEYFPFDLNIMKHLLVLKLSGYYMDKKYNYPCINLFPCNLKYLDLGENYNNLLNNLPNDLIALVISTNYNHKIIDLPMELTSLYFNNHCIYNHPFTILPKKLKILYFSSGCLFNNSINNLPSNLEILGFGFLCEFNQSIKNLPSSLKILKLYNDYDFINLTKFPNNLEKLCICGKISPSLIPNNLKTLKILIDEKYYLDYIKNLKNEYPYLEIHVGSIWESLGSEEF